MKYKKYEALNFNSAYKSKGYPKKTWPLLNEFFSRYKHEFNLSDTEIHTKLNILLNNLDDILFVSDKDISEVAHYDASIRWMQFSDQLTSLTSRRSHKHSSYILSRIKSRARKYPLRCSNIILQWKQLYY